MLGVEFVSGCIDGKTVLVTGGGGSIGSEICRQLANLSPACVIIFDIYENTAYELYRELVDGHRNDSVEWVVEIGSIRDEEVIAAADAAGIAMVFTGARHFLH
jgi:FlaA1/EpsC-like NDP-sugar epimerase